MTSARAIDLAIPAGGARFPGTLALPHAPRGVVLFAHGSGSSRVRPKGRARGRTPERGARR
jgi:hypothetical protein